MIGMTFGILLNVNDMTMKDPNHQLLKQLKMDSQDKAQEQIREDEEQKMVQPSTDIENQNNEPAQDGKPVEETLANTETTTPKVEEEKPKTQEKNPAEQLPANENNTTNSEKKNESAERKTEKKVYSSKKEVLERIKEIAKSVESPDKDEVDTLKSLFYRFHIAEREQHQKDYLEAGGDPEKYVITPDEDEDSFKAEMQIIKEKRAKIFEKQEAEKAENLKKKLDIIEKIKGMATSPDEANKSFNEFKALQQEFKDIKAVPPEKANEVWRNYQLYVERFYDLLNLNREAREYDFKKNLEMKTTLCEEAEKLDEEPDVVSAFHQLQELHAQYREIGPVAKELRDEIWARFKAASTIINKKHQKHFEALREKEKENLEKKTGLCEKVENITKEDNKTASDWEKHTKQIIAIQQEWKTIGFAPQKMNVKIFERFRAVCDDFFGRKAEFFKGMKEQFAENAEKKKALVEKAKALTNSTDWKATSDKLIALQKEWKTIGMVPKKQGDRLWNEFLTACNHFFEARNAATSDSRHEQRDNLKKKYEIIDKLNTLAENATENAQEQVHQLTEAYNNVGHVPFKDKDKIYKAYHDALDKVYNELHISVAKRKLDNFKNSLKSVAKRGEDAMDNERGRLVRRYEQLKQDIITYENNLGFLNISSKKGNSLVDEMNRKVQKLKDEVELVREKIKAIDNQAKEEEKKDEA